MAAGSTVAFADDGDATYEAMRLRLSRMLGGDIIGRSIDDQQLPNGLFPAPCLRLDTHAQLRGGVGHATATTPVLDGAAAYEEEHLQGRINRLLDGTARAENSLAFHNPARPQMAPTNVPTAPLYVSREEEENYMRIRSMAML